MAPPPVAEHGLTNGRCRRNLDIRLRSAEGPLSTHAAIRVPYSITSSARASSDCGTVRSSALAVFIFTTSSYFVGA
jgi:hypothetical protein